MLQFEHSTAFTYAQSAKMQYLKIRQHLLTLRMQKCYVKKTRFDFGAGGENRY